MNTKKIIINAGCFKSEDMSLAVSKDVSELDFKTAFSFYIENVGMSVSELSMRSGVTERTIRRYRNESRGKDIKTIVALCIGLGLCLKRSLHLINLAGLSLTPTYEHNLYFLFLCNAYCSNLTVKDCNDILVSNGYNPLV